MLGTLDALRPPATKEKAWTAVDTDRMRLIVRSTIGHAEALAKTDRSAQRSHTRALAFLWAAHDEWESMLEQRPGVAKRPAVGTGSESEERPGAPDVTEVLRANEGAT